jgi:hypothetical protein
MGIYVIIQELLWQYSSARVLTWCICEYLHNHGFQLHRWPETAISDSQASKTRVQSISIKPVTRTYVIQRRAGARKQRTVGPHDLQIDDLNDVRHGTL